MLKESIRTGTLSEGTAPVGLQLEGEIQNTSMMGWFRGLLAPIDQHDDGQQKLPSKKMQGNAQR